MALPVGDTAHRRPANENVTVGRAADRLTDQPDKGISGVLRVAFGARLTPAAGAIQFSRGDAR
jgi:hypothetical protein